MITQEYLKTQLLYNAETGEFSWAIGKKGRRCDRVGTVNNFGYLIITLDYERYVASRLAWLYMTGEWPVNEVDHIDRDQGNNRWANLREASRSENARNTQTRSDNSSGHRGVCWDNQKLKWKVQISVKGGKRLQKHFHDFDDAVNWYRLRALELFGEYEIQE